MDALSTRPAARRDDDADRDTRQFAVLDIDGVLADVRHRLHYVASRPKDWAAFFAAAPRDAPLQVGAELANRLASDHAIIYLTGRSERCRADTQAWLDDKRLPHGELHMRREGDRRPARVTKPALLRTLSRRGRVGIVVDDDPAVCAALAAAGWPVQLADWMPRPETLDEAQEREGRT